MPRLDDPDLDPGVVDGVQDSVVTHAKAVPGPALQGLGSGRPRILRELTDRVQNAFALLGIDLA
jgi:hypothetical protein